MPVPLAAGSIRASVCAEHLDQHSGRHTEAANGFAPGGWYVESLRASLRMDVDPPQLIEDRRIVATADELDELIVSLSAPRDDGTVSDAIMAEMVYGGEIVEQQQVGPSHARFVIRLPRPLSLGQRHEYGIHFNSYSRRHLRPYYVLTPFRRCETFALNVRFGTQSLPDALWRLNGVPPRLLDDWAPTSDSIVLDRVGEAHLQFHGLGQGLSYGLQWTPSR